MTPLQPPFPPLCSPPARFRRHQRIPDAGCPPCWTRHPLRSQNPARTRWDRVPGPAFQCYAGPGEVVDSGRGDGWNWSELRRPSGELVPLQSESRLRRGDAEHAISRCQHHPMHTQNGVGETGRELVAEEALSDPHAIDRAGQPYLKHDRSRPGHQDHR